MRDGEEDVGVFRARGYGGAIGGGGGGVGLVVVGGGGGRQGQGGAVDEDRGVAGIERDLGEEVCEAGWGGTKKEKFSSDRLLSALDWPRQKVEGCGSDW